MDSNDDLLQTMQKMLDTLKGKTKRSTREAEAAKLMNIANNILGKGHQSFYEKGKEIKKEEEGKGGSKGKGKGKGKSKAAKALPRFDLSRSFPKREITKWQHVMKSLEEGHEPRGEVAICEDEQQIVELQMMHKALGLKKEIMLISKAGEEKVEGCKKVLLPYVGNLPSFRLRLRA